MQSYSILASVAHSSGQHTWSLRIHLGEGILCSRLLCCSPTCRLDSKRAGSLVRTMLPLRACLFFALPSYVSVATQKPPFLTSQLPHLALGACWSSLAPSLATSSFELAQATVQRFWLRVLAAFQMKVFGGHLPFCLSQTVRGQASSLLSSSPLSLLQNKLIMTRGADRGGGACN